MSALDRVRKASSLALCAAGVGLLAYWLAATVDAHVFQARLAHRLETTGPGTKSSSVAGVAATRHEAIATGLVGRLEIPRLGLSAMITEGVNDRALGRGIGHVPSTAFPGEPGNVGLAAHRDTYFRTLKDVDTRDLVRLVTPGGIFAYEVEWARIVEPDRVDLLANDVGSALTLVTCYPFSWIGSAPKRFVVRCRPLGGQGAVPADPVPSVAAAGPSAEEPEGVVPVSSPVGIVLDSESDSMWVHEEPVRPERSEGPAIAGPLENPILD